MSEVPGITPGLKQKSRRLKSNSQRGLMLSVYPSLKEHAWKFLSVPFACICLNSLHSICTRNLTVLFLLLFLIKEEEGNGYLIGNSLYVSLL